MGSRRGEREEAWTAAPMMPASFWSWAATSGVRISMWGRNFSAFLLTPPPTMISSGQRSDSSSAKYCWSRCAQCFHERSSRSRTESAAQSSASPPSSGRWPSSVFGDEDAVGEHRAPDPGARGSPPRRCRCDPCPRRTASRPGRRRRRRSSPRPSRPSASPNSVAASTPIHAGSMLAAVSTTPSRTTAGIVIPIGPDPSSCPTTSRDRLAAPRPGVAGDGVEDPHPVGGELAARRRRPAPP